MIPVLAKVLETTTDYLFGCVRGEQRVFCFSVCEGSGGGNTGKPWIAKYRKVLNEDYLSKGWRVVQSALSSEEVMTYMLVVLERAD